MPSLIDIASSLSSQLAGLSFSSPVSFVYDPTDYASELLRIYLEKYGRGPKKIVLVGMNPGPWGMLQTGVPFGEVGYVRDWMGIEGNVSLPEKLHPKRPVDGLKCTRSEVSGRRLWGWAKKRFGEAPDFFRDFFILNYCPLAFFDGDGRNITPDRLRADDKLRLFRVCDGALRESIAALTPEYVIGLGNFAYDRADSSLDGTKAKIGRITHPSPANPAANKGWEELLERELADLGIELPLNVSE
jgi:single-strand selective monofunctional uracil DNA glycosylase